MLPVLNHQILAQWELLQLSNCVFWSLNAPLCSWSMVYDIRLCEVLELSGLYVWGQVWWRFIDWQLTQVKVTSSWNNSCDWLRHGGPECTSDFKGVTQHISVSGVGRLEAVWRFSIEPVDQRTDTKLLGLFRNSFFFKFGTFYLSYTELSLKDWLFLLFTTETNKWTWKCRWPNDAMVSEKKKKSPETEQTKCHNLINLFCSTKKVTSLQVLCLLVLLQMLCYNISAQQCHIAILF